MQLLQIADRVYEIPRQEFYGESVHIYLIEEDASLVVVDGADARQDTMAALAAFGKPLKIVLTHGPTARGVATLKRTLPVPVDVYLHVADRSSPWLTIDPDECILWKNGDLTLTPGVTAIHTPGHSPGHCCVYYPANRGMLFTGDAVQGDQYDGILDIYESGTDWDTGQNVASLRSLAEQFAFEMILPFHYSIVRTRALEKLQAALEQK